MKVLAILLALALCAITVSALVPIDEVVAKALEKHQSLNILVKFPTRPRADANLLKSLTRVERQKLVYTELLAVASASQGKLREELTKRGFEVKTFWLGNTMYIKNATPALIRELRALKNVIEIEAEKEVARVHEPMIHEVFDTLPASAAKNVKNDKRAVEWNIEIINADDAWATSRGFNVTLANIDTGVLYTHESLVRSYRGNLGNGAFDHDFNWFDPRGQAIPYDNNGHGTHTMGSITGDDLVSGIGTAPDSRWIAAKGCAAASCSNADLIGSFQYLFAPTRQDGSDADTNQAPQVISNSWGGGQGSTSFLPYIEPHVEVGTTVTFSQGNSGSGCGTANSPGDLAIVIGVGSTDINDALSSFSSRGPSVLGAPNFATQKPDIAAPGERVLSSYYTSNTAYATLSGTSMACPHVTGVIGLMYQVNPDLTVDEVRRILTGTSSHDVSTPNGGLTTCGGIPYTTWPNYHYGFGRIDALAAVNAAKSLRK